MYELSVTYPADQWTRDEDTQIDQIVGRRHGDSGMGLGYRDLHYRFRSPADADAAARRIVASGRSRMAIVEEIP